VSIIVLNIKKVYKNKAFKKPQKIHPHQTYPLINITKIIQKSTKENQKNIKNTKRYQKGG